jgi:arginine utilization protein RocB
MISFREEVTRLTKKLVSQPSIVGTPGEKDMAYLIWKILGEHPYFQDHPHHLRLVPTRDDDRERYNVMALVKGGSGEYRDTVILMGHFDTVGVEDYGKWQPLAFSPDDLLEAWKNSDLPPAVRADFETGDYLPGRGAVDMKSGIAINIAVFLHFAGRREELPGNLLFIAACDEENNSRGMLSAVEDVHPLAEEENLTYIAAINSDYTSPRWEGDPHRYVYLGTVGKLLPTFYVVGKETHAGQAFEGFDPNLVVSELTARIDYNPDLCDELYGETTIPPVSLKQSDLKPRYDVQTPHSALVYYNFFVHGQSPADVLVRLKQLAREAFDAAVRRYRDRCLSYSARTGLPAEPVTPDPRVVTYEEILAEAIRKHGAGFEAEWRKFLEELAGDPELDIREYSLRAVEELWRRAGDAEPVLILFYSSPYIPRVVLNEEEETGRRLMEAVRKAVDDIRPFTPHPLEVRKFFPYISDMSFVALSDDEEDLEAFRRNMPAWETKHRVNTEAIRRLNVPVVNIGPYGKDAHKKWERVEITWSMETAPNLTIQVIHHLLSS